MLFKALISQSENYQCVLDTFFFSSCKTEHRTRLSHHHFTLLSSTELSCTTTNYLKSINAYPYRHHHFLSFSPLEKQGSTKPRAGFACTMQAKLGVKPDYRASRRGLFPPQHVEQSNLNFFNDSSWQNLNCPAHSSPTLPWQEILLLLPVVVFSLLLLCKHILHFLQCAASTSDADVNSCCQFVSILWVQTATLLNRWYAHALRQNCQKIPAFAGIDTKVL